MQKWETEVSELYVKELLSPCTNGQKRSIWKWGEREKEGSRKKRNYLHGKSFSVQGCQIACFPDNFEQKINNILILFKQEGLIYWFAKSLWQKHDKRVRKFAFYLRGNPALRMRHTWLWHGGPFFSPPYPHHSLPPPPSFHAAQYISGGGWYKKKG